MLQNLQQALKTNLKRAIQKTLEVPGDLTGNEIAHKITKSSKTSETVTNEHDKEVPKER